MAHAEPRVASPNRPAVSKAPALSGESARGRRSGCRWPGVSQRRVCPELSVSRQRHDHPAGKQPERELEHNDEHKIERSPLRWVTSTPDATVCLPCTACQALARRCARPARDRERTATITRASWTLRFGSILTGSPQSAGDHELPNLGAKARSGPDRRLPGSPDAEHRPGPRRASAIRVAHPGHRRAAEWPR